MNQDTLRKYARTLLQYGVNLQQDQTLVISVDVENKDFAVIVTEEAYELGAKEVVLNWRCSPIARQRLLHAKESVLEKPANWIPEFYKQYIDDKAAFLSLISANPKALEGIPTDRISLQSRNLNKALSFYHTAIMNSSVTWCVASVPTVLWADLLGYKGTDEEKINQLWDTLLKLCRIEGVEPKDTYRHHMAKLRHRCEALNKLDLKALRYTCENGTDLLLELPEGHIWLGGEESSKDGTIFNANIPTEEVFSAPQYNGVNGIVYSTKPLIYHGNTISDFSFTFKEGKIVEYTAKEGYEVLKELVENSIDAGSKNITVEVVKGGIESITIIDDGHGIKKDDVEMAFERHATSKIRSAKDIESIRTMGFRGEALASVAAISRVTMVTKTDEDELRNKNCGRSTEMSFLKKI